MGGKISKKEEPSKDERICIFSSSMFFYFIVRKIRTKKKTVNSKNWEKISIDGGPDSFLGSSFAVTTFPELDKKIIVVSNLSKNLFYLDLGLLHYNVYYVINQ